MNKTLKNLAADVSGQALTEYVIVSSGVVLGMIAFLHTDVLETFPGGIYKGVYLLLKGLMRNVALPIP